MIFDVMIVTILMCMFPQDVGERFQRQSCVMSVSDVIDKTPQSPYNALVRIDELEAEIYEKSQFCSDVVDIERKVYLEKLSDIQKLIARSKPNYSQSGFKPNYEWQAMYRHGWQACEDASIDIIIDAKK